MSEPEPVSPAEPETPLPAEPEIRPAEPETPLPAEPEIRPVEPETPLPAEPEMCPAEPEPPLPAEPERRPAEPEPPLPAEPEIRPEPEPAPPHEQVLQPELDFLNVVCQERWMQKIINHDSRDNHDQNQDLMPPHNLLKSDNYFEICVPLHNAALEGNWEAAKEIIENHSQTILRKAIAKGGSTVLHLAVGARKRTFVEKLLDSVKQNDDSISKLLLQGDENNNNAFCFAAATGDVDIAKLMLEKKPGLQNVCGYDNQTPLYLAVVFGQKDMANFLYPRTKGSLIQNESKDLFIRSIDMDLYVITLKLLNNWERSGTIREFWGRQAQAQDIDKNGTGASALRKLAQKPNLKTDDDALTLVNRLWKSLIDSHTSKQVKDLIRNRKNMLFDAAKQGNFEFIAVAVRSYPDLIYEFDGNVHGIFHLAVQHRHVDIFDLISRMGFHRDLLTTYVDNNGNNVLHLAARYPNPPPPKIVPGAALELQREILIFEEVERIFPPSYRDQKNNSNKTPKELFTKTHKNLRERGEKWMNSTATSCMLVATLIATVVFAAAFTVPGGNDQETANPLLLHKNFFKVFAASDAIAFFSSSISILIFLSILTSRYEEKDFRMRLPLKLMFGLLTLFISLIAMTLAFSSAIILFYSQRWNGITGPSFALVLVAGSLYLVLHFSLLKDVIRSTFCFRRSTFCSRNQIKTKCLPV